MDVVLKHLNDWLAEKRKNDWCETTYHSERRRLTPLVPYLTGKGEDLWNEFESRQTGMYSRLTALIRITQFWEWMYPSRNANPYRALHREKRRFLKNCYQEKLPEVTYEAASAKISKIKNKEDRDMAVLLLSCGLRFTESLSLKAGDVVGKGGKKRRVYPPDELTDFKYGQSYQHFYYTLTTQTGLKPHDLRKIFLSKIANNGMNHFELCRVAGWSNIKTATKYISVSNERIKAIIESARKVS